MYSTNESPAQQRAALARAIRAAKDIADGATGATLSRDLETVTTGYAVGTATVEVSTRAELLELLDAIMFTRSILLNGLQTNAEGITDEWLGVGLWRDPSGRIITEITAVIPSSEVTEAAAVEIGRQLQQSCIYYLDEEREIPCSPSSSPSSSN